MVGSLRLKNKERQKPHLKLGRVDNMKTPWSDLIKTHGTAFATFVVVSLCGFAMFVALGAAILIAKVLVLIK
jgi:hypothetical protein